MPLDTYELTRYSRQLALIGEEKQEKLKSSTVLVVGAGGLGSIVSIYLTYMGVGKIIIIDNGVVELDNLNRQILYSDKDINEYKAKIACKKLSELNSRVVVECHEESFNEDIGDELVKKADVVIDALDNWRSRLVLNNLCVVNRKPLVHGGVEGWHGQVMTIIPGETACLNCLFVDRKIMNRKTVIPIMGFTPGVVGLIEVAEAVKILIKSGDLLANKLLLIDLYTMEFRVINIERNPRCPICSRI